MFRALLTIFLLGFSLQGLTAASQIQEGEAKSEACNFTDVKTIYWQALEETVTLHTQVSQEGEDYPRAKLHIEFADGKILDLGGGGKYYDDYAADNPPSCEDILGAATNSTIVSLNDDASLWRPELNSKMSPYKALDIKVYRTMSDLRADLLFAQNCDLKDEDEELAMQCEILGYLAEKVVENESNLPKHEFNRLVVENAPIIKVTGSTYYSVTYVYDSQSNSVRELFVDGC